MRPRVPSEPSRRPLLLPLEHRTRVAGWTGWWRALRGDVQRGLLVERLCCQLHSMLASPIQCTVALVSSGERSGVRITYTTVVALLPSVGFTDICLLSSP